MGLAFIGGGGGGGGAFEYKMIGFAMSLIILVPTLFILFVPGYSDNHDWEEEMGSIENTYYEQTGQSSTTSQNVWTLTGIYTPYGGNGSKYGYTPDGWIFGHEVTYDSPVQYTGNVLYPGNLVVIQAPNKLFYYLSVPETLSESVVPLKESSKYESDVMDGDTVVHKKGDYVITDGKYDNNYHYEGEKIVITSTAGATVYSSVTFDRAHKSDIFFTTSSKTETDEGYYYAYTGYRYVFQPLSDYTTTIGGITEKVKANSTSLSLIWYEYYTVSGIAGQLAVSGSDKGISYLTSDDIIRQFNSSNYTSTFDMTFNSVQMHLVIRLDPARLTGGYSIADCYNLGYWSVLVYSDAVADSMASSTYEFSAENILNTLISLFTFRVAEDYDIDGWLGIFASMMITMPLYIALLVICLEHPELWIFFILLALIQSLLTMVTTIADGLTAATGWWPF